MAFPSTFGFGIGFGPKFDTKKSKKANKTPSGPRRAGPGYKIGSGQARGTPK